VTQRIRRFQPDAVSSRSPCIIYAIWRTPAALAETVPNSPALGVPAITRSGRRRWNIHNSRKNETRSLMGAISLHGNHPGPCALVLNRCQHRSRTGDGFHIEPVSSQERDLAFVELPTHVRRESDHEPVPWFELFFRHVLVFYKRQSRGQHGLAFFPVHRSTQQ
jgi:hypothetical protein